MKAPHCPRMLSRTGLLLVAVIFVFRVHVFASPITYTLVVANGGAAGTIGTVAFSNAVLTFTFEGDTANVVDFSAPVSGHEILMGTASVEVADINGQVIAQATFLPAAGIFVSVDNSNEGIGFGSLGGLPGSTQFPGLPTYPYAQFATDPRLSTYDLRTNFSSGFEFVLSCTGFPSGPCTPLALPTTAGDLVITQSGPLCCSTFTAQLQPLTSFAAFSATANVHPGTSGSFSLAGRFTLGTGSNGINPLTETVTLQLGAYSVTLPSGSFRRGRDGVQGFRGVINGTALSVQLSYFGASRYGIRAQGSGANLTGTSIPATVNLTIGDDTGSTTAVSPHDD